ncbi:Heterokaryon incompatibility protein (HET) domain containing protein, partial [Naviculisporaceae sp. PSN 640]
MSRWHTHCDNPDIFVDKALPQCRNCGKSPSTSDVAPPEHAPPPPWTVPPDEEAGQLNLRWPACVPYRAIPWTDDRFSDLGFAWLYSNSLVDSRSLDYAEMTLAPTEVPESSLSTVYPRRLGSEEFRLIILKPPQHPDDPVHLTLETYHRDNCPDYEATSYCWGGEEGDNSLSDHVFVGPHWDIILTTRNCRSMLQYLRPRRGLRTVWVDAICINQNDVIERGDQVAAMEKTYRRCMRLVVYLGADVVQRSNDDIYPIRRDLDQLYQASTSLSDLLHRRYFSRVWAIQELILAPSAIIPLKKMEFRTRIPDTDLSMIDWDNTAAPWFYWAVSYQERQDIELAGVLNSSWNCQASDPRDKVFGVFGLLHHRDRRALQPDYTITLAHTKIGTWSYILFKHRNPEVLLSGRGNATPVPPYPSWVPEWS